jgi:hypothetical protein
MAAGNPGSISSGQEVNGPSASPPVSNSTYIGAIGGDGNNHPTSIAVSRIVRPVIEAQSWSAQ